MTIPDQLQRVRDFQQAINDYNSQARFNGWLPIEISIQSSQRTIYDASERCKSLYPETSKSLKSGIVP